MASSNEDADLAPSVAAGYRITEKKTVDEYAALDSNDESLKKWKESLGIGAGEGIIPSDPNDPRRVIVEQLALEVAGRPDVILDMSNKAAVEQLKQKPFIIKEGTEYRMKVKFRIQHEVITGLRYIQVVKRKGIKVDRMEEMLGSYAPGKSNEKKFPLEEAPSGMLARGKYEARSKFTDDDGHSYLDFTWSFEVNPLNSIYIFSVLISQIKKGWD